MDRRRRGGGSRGRVLFYRSVRALPGSDTSISTTPRTTHGPLLRDLRKGIDGRLQPPVVGDEPRSSPPPHEAESPAADHRAEGTADESARLHPLPAHAAEVRQVADPAPFGGRHEDALPRPVVLRPVVRVA